MIVASQFTIKSALKTEQKSIREDFSKTKQKKEKSLLKKE
jgi:hypothetical protein